MTVLDRWQFRIDREQKGSSFQAGQFYVHVGPEVKIAKVKSDHGADLGYLIGSAIDLSETCLVQDEIEISVEDRAVFPDLLQAVLSRLGGNYLWISVCDGHVRIVPDAMAQVGLVFDPKRCRAGSTPTAILEEKEYEASVRRDLYTLLDVDKEGWFPAGLTSHQGIRRLLPHHYLDLEDWQMRRFGPVTGAIPASPEEMSAEIAQTIEIQLKALSKAPKRLAVTLTAGLDSRVVLACCRDFAADLDFMTLQTKGMRSVDAIVAKNIARKFNLRQIELPIITSTDSERELFIKRGGHCVADSNSLYHPSIWAIAKTHNLAGGLGGEIGRAFLYQRELPDLEQIDGKFINGLLGLPASQEVISALDSWLIDAPKSSSEELLDFTYYENRMGPWAMVQRYSDPTLERFSPMIAYRPMELMLNLPYEWKLGSLFEHHIIKERWKELGDFPINSLGPWADKYYLVAEALRNPHKVAKFFRKRMAKFR